MGLFSRKKEEEVQYEDVTSTLLTCKSYVDDLNDNIDAFLKLSCKSFKKISNDEIDIVLKDDTKAKITIDNSGQSVKDFTNSLDSIYHNNYIKQEFASSIYKQLEMFDTLLTFTYKIALGSIPHVPTTEQFLYKLAQRIGAFVVFSNSCLYTHEGKLLTSLDGDSTYDCFFPLEYGNLKLAQEENETDDQRARRELSTMRLMQKDLSFIPEFAAFDIQDGQVKLIDEVLYEIAKKYLFASRSYKEINGIENINDLMNNELVLLKHMYTVNKVLSEEDVDYILQGNNAEEYLTYKEYIEDLSVLLWSFNAISVSDCNKANDFETVSSCVMNYSIDDMATSTLRNINSILKEVDYYMRLNWIKESLVKNNMVISKMNNLVVERRYATLKWLVENK